MSETTPNNGIKCNTCLAIFPNSDAIKEHYRGDWHIFNTKRRGQNLPVVRRDQFIAFLQSAASKGLIKPQAKPLVPTSNSSSHRKIGSQVVEDKKVKKEEEEPLESEENNKEEGEEEEQEDDEGDWEDIDDEEISPLNSLFDNKKFESHDDAYDYMVKKYSFFVPDIEYLVDLEGLLEYLQEKVRLGNMCLYCEKRFSSTIACQHHMISSSHCKMKYEEDNIDEYEDFYDFSSQESLDVDEDGNPINKELEINSSGELVLPSGKTLGNRMFRKYYNQHYRVDNGESSEIVLLQQKEELLRLNLKFGGPEAERSSQAIAKLSNIEVLTQLSLIHRQSRKALTEVQRHEVRAKARNQRVEAQNIVNKRRNAEVTTAKIRDYHGILK